MTGMIMSKASGAWILSVPQYLQHWLIMARRDQPNTKLVLESVLVTCIIAASMKNSHVITLHIATTIYQNRLFERSAQLQLS